MKITFNNKSITLKQPATINMLLADQDTPKLGIALSVNKNIIPRSKWESYQVQDGDEILVFQAIAGG